MRKQIEEFIRGVEQKTGHVRLKKMVHPIIFLFKYLCTIIFFSSNIFHTFSLLFPFLPLYFECLFTYFCSLIFHRILRFTLSIPTFARCILARPMCNEKQQAQAGFSFPSARPDCKCGFTFSFCHHSAGGEMHSFHF